MVRIAPVRLSFNPKTLWFDATELELAVGDAVVVQTARGQEFGHVDKPVFDMEYEDTKKLQSPLKPVVRLATDEDVAQSEKMSELSMAALPIFRQMAAESLPDMNPIAVEYLFSGDKAVFYFESEERVDFRELVRKLVAEFHVRVDMKQIGVRDGARMVGGIGHCGQELCCSRLGGQFNPVSVRMAKEQDLSLNPQKISGLCGRLMCCLRYEFDAYKDFHARAPKKNARIQTPDGEGKVVDLDVPREIISIKVGDEKPVKVPLADMEPAEEGSRPNAVGEEAWEKANTPTTYGVISSSNLFTSQLSGEDKLAEPGKVRHVHGDEPKQPKSSRSRSRRRGGSGNSDQGSSAATDAAPRKQRRRRSTTVSSDGTAKVTEKAGQEGSQPKKDGDAAEKKTSSRRRSRSRGGSKQKQQERVGGEKQQGKSVQVGRNSSALRQNRDGQKPQSESGDSSQSAGQGQRRRRRTHKPSEPSE